MQAWDATPRWQRRARRWGVAVSAAWLATSLAIGISSSTVGAVAPARRATARPRIPTPPTLVPSGVSLSAVERTSADRVVGSFTSSSTGDVAADFTATIDWGDGTLTPGTITGSAGSFSVDGTHSYADEGKLTITVTVSGPSGSGCTIVSTLTSTEGDVLSLLSAASVAQDSPSFSNVALADLTDSAAGAYASDLTATIAWGDGTTTTGTVAGTPADFTIFGSHTYAANGSHAVTVTITDPSPGTAKLVVHATLKGGPVLTGSTPTVTATEGVARNGSVATVHDSITSDLASALTATITWGDGTTSAATVSGGGGTFTISGAHTWADEGSYPTTISVSGPSGSSLLLHGTATVAEHDVLSPVGTTAVAAVAGTPTSAATTIATFHDSWAGNVAADLTATIAWGDGTSSAGTVSGSGATWHVSGSHRYREPGSFTVQVVLGDDAPGTATATATGTATVTGITWGAAFVTAATTDFLGRSPTAGELSTWAGPIDAGTQPRSALVTTLSSSPEWVQTIVQNLYVNTLGRPGDPGGVAYWVAQIRTGVRTVAQVAASFYASPEYYGGIGGGSDASWLTDLYQKLLGRSPDAAGLSYWEGQVTTSGRTSVASRFYDSGESARQRVTRLFQKLLGRSPDAGGLTYWAGRVVTDGDLALAANLAASDEYADRARTRFP